MQSKRYSHSEIVQFEHEMKALEDELNKLKHIYKHTDEQKNDINIETPIFLYSPTPSSLRTQVSSYMAKNFVNDAYNFGVPLVSMCVNFKYAPHSTEEERIARIDQAKATLRYIAFTYCIDDTDQQVNEHGAKVLKGKPLFATKINIAGQSFLNILENLDKPTPAMYMEGVKTALIQPLVDDAFTRFVPELKNEKKYSDDKCDHFFHALKLDEEIQTAFTVITIYHLKLTDLANRLKTPSSASNKEPNKKAQKAPKIEQDALVSAIMTLEHLSQQLVELQKGLNTDFENDKNSIAKRRIHLYECISKCHKALGGQAPRLDFEGAKLVVTLQGLLYPTEMDEKFQQLKSKSKLTGSDKGSDKGSNKGSDKNSVHSAAPPVKSVTTIGEQPSAHQRTASLTLAQKKMAAYILSIFGNDTSASVGATPSPSGKSSTVVSPTDDNNESKNTHTNTSNSLKSLFSSKQTPPNLRLPALSSVPSSTPTTPTNSSSSISSGSSSSTLSRSMSSHNLLPDSANDNSNTSTGSASFSSIMSFSSSSLDDSKGGVETPKHRQIDNENPHSSNHFRTFIPLHLRIKGSIPTSSQSSTPTKGNTPTSSRSSTPTKKK